MGDICYLIEAVATIIDTLDKLIVSGDISSDFQTVMCKLDYLGHTFFILWFTDFFLTKSKSEEGKK